MALFVETWRFAKVESRATQKQKAESRASLKKKAESRASLKQRPRLSGTFPAGAACFGVGFL
jgi:hypothetical protein